MKKLTTSFLILLMFGLFAKAQVSSFMYVKVAPENQAEFERLETTYWSQVAKKGIDDGKMIAWGLMRKVGIAGSDANYILRQGTKTGYTSADWIVSANGSNSNVPNWILSTSSSKVYPTEFSGWEGIKDVYGALNPSAESLSVNEVLEAAFSIYPNPASEVVHIESGDYEISSVELFDVVGQKISEEKDLTNNQLNVSSLSKGVYIVKINTEAGSLNKRIVIE